MTKLFSIFCVLFLLVSCSSSEDTTEASLFGTWKLSETNNDPGDGSGVFTKTNSAKVLVFQNNNEVTSNGSLCDNTINSDSPSSGTYTIKQDVASSGTIIPSACNYNLANASQSIQFEIKGSLLYVYYPCIEGCSAKYVKEK